MNRSIYDTLSSVKVKTFSWQTSRAHPVTNFQDRNEENTLMKKHVVRSKNRPGCLWFIGE